MNILSKLLLIFSFFRLFYLLSIIPIVEEEGSCHKDECVDFKGPEKKKVKFEGVSEAFPNCFPKYEIRSFSGFVNHTVMITAVASAFESDLTIMSSSPCNQWLPKVKGGDGVLKEDYREIATNRSRCYEDMLDLFLGVQCFKGELVTRSKNSEKSPNERFFCEPKLNHFNNLVFLCDMESHLDPNIGKYFVRLYKSVGEREDRFYGKTTKKNKCILTNEDQWEPLLSEPLEINVCSKTSTLKKNELATCTMIGRPLSYKFVREFVEFHRVVGVSHLFMYYLGSSSHFSCFLKELEYGIERGAITVIDWRSFVDNLPRELQTHNMEFYLNFMRMDCFHRHKHFFDYITPIDDDEFIVPINNHRTIPSALRQDDLDPDDMGVVSFAFFPSPSYVPVNKEDLFIEAFVEPGYKLLSNRSGGTKKYILQTSAKAKISVFENHNIFHRRNSRFVSSSWKPETVKFSENIQIIHYMVWKVVSSNPYNPLILENEEEVPLFPYPSMSKFFPILKQRLKELPPGGASIIGLNPKCELYSLSLEDFLNEFLQNSEEQKVDTLSGLLGGRWDKAKRNESAYNGKIENAKINETNKDVRRNLTKSISMVRDKDNNFQRDVWLSPDALYDDIVRRRRAERRNASIDVSGDGENEKKNEMGGKEVDEEEEDGKKAKDEIGGNVHDDYNSSYGVTPDEEEAELERDEGRQWRAEIEAMTLKRKERERKKEEMMKEAYADVKKARREKRREKKKPKAKEDKI